MQCINCQFFNLPGSSRCARCDSPLDLSAVAIEPPRRAGALLPAAAGRFVVKAGVASRESRQAFAARLEAHSLDQVEWSAVWRSIIPGRGQAFMGHRKVGALITITWSAALALAILFMGDGMGSFFALVTLGIHSCSISLLLAHPLRRSSVATRVAAGLFFYALLLYGVYLPLRWVIQGVYRPFVVESVPIRSSRLFQVGDILLLSGRWSGVEIRRGDVIAVSLDALSIPGAYVRAGAYVDRVIGIEGDTVTVDHGVITLNGAPLGADLMPLGVLPPIPPLGLTVPPGHLFLLPTAFHSSTGASMVDRLLVVPAITTPSREHVLGRVSYRWRPFSRMGRLVSESPTARSAP